MREEIRSLCSVLARNRDYMCRVGEVKGIANGARDILIPPEKDAAQKRGRGFGDKRVKRIERGLPQFIEAGQERVALIMSQDVNPGIADQCED